MKKTILTVMTIASLTACNKKKRVGMIEMTTFKLNDGVSSADFVKSAE